MFEALISGLGYGLMVSFMLGTVFFALINNGIQHGARAGVAIASGVVFTDLVFIVLAYWFTEVTSQFIKAHTFAITLLGGLFVIVLGVLGLYYKTRFDLNPKEQQFRPFRLFLTGALLNSSNPVNFFFWLALQSVLVGKGIEQERAFVFFASCLSAILLTEIAIASLAQRLTRKSGKKWLSRIKAGINILFIAVGLALLVNLFFTSN